MADKKVHFDEGSARRLGGKEGVDLTWKRFGLWLQVLVTNIFRSLVFLEVICPCYHF